MAILVKASFRIINDMFVTFVIKNLINRWTGYISQL